MSKPAEPYLSDWPVLTNTFSRRDFVRSGALVAGAMADTIPAFAYSSPRDRRPSSLSSRVSRHWASTFSSGVFLPAVASYSADSGAGHGIQGSRRLGGACRNAGSGVGELPHRS